MIMMIGYSEKYNERLCYFEIHSVNALVVRAQFLNRSIERSDQKVAPPVYRRRRRRLEAVVLLSI